MRQWSVPAVSGSIAWAGRNKSAGGTAEVGDLWADLKRRGRSLTRAVAKVRR